MADGAIVVAICQYGGEFASGPSGNLIYRGGEAHAVDVTRDSSLEGFKDELSKVFHVDVTDMSLKYFLPNNMKTLITISCDRDLQRMVDFTANAAHVDVFLISRQENRYVWFYLFLKRQAYHEVMDCFVSCWIIRSIVTQSGATSGSVASGDKRKRPTSKNKYVVSLVFFLSTLCTTPYSYKHHNQCYPF